MFSDESGNGSKLEESGKEEVEDDNKANGLKDENKNEELAENTAEQTNLLSDVNVN